MEKAKSVDSSKVEAGPGIVLFRLTVLQDEVKTPGGIIVPNNPDANPSLGTRTALATGVVISAGEHQGQKGAPGAAVKGANWIKPGTQIWVLPHDYYRVVGLVDSACDIHACRCEAVWAYEKAK